jgi:predicted transcriptional regulator
LKIAQASHNETISKLSVAERELDQLQKMKKQVDEYRTELTESKIKIDELTSSLRQKEQHLDEVFHYWLMFCKLMSL